MKQRKWRVSADVPAATSASLMQAHPPRFSQVFALSLTWAYGVDQDYPFDTAMTDCTLYGLHTGYDTQAFLASFAGDALRPDGQLLFLTYCTDLNVPPAQAGVIDLNHVELIEPVLFGTALVLRPAWVMTPTLVQPQYAPVTDQPTGWQ